jgi:KDO2-lipid IV(A) lauroyltransferase
MLPYRTAVAVGGVLGAAAFRVIKKSRTIVERHLKEAFPEKEYDEIYRIARTSFINQGKNAFELFSFPNLTSSKLREIVHIENKIAFEQALAPGKGVLIASAHCGNWEIMGAALADAGFPINVIARKIYLDGLNQLLVDFRESKKMHVILRSDPGAAKQMLRALRNNGSIAMLIDQDTSVQGVFVDFFGRPAWTPSGLASLAFKTGAAVIIALDVRQPDDSHCVVLSGPFWFEKTSDTEKDIMDATSFLTHLIENHIRQNPEQWVWMHERWKTQPQ